MPPRSRDVAALRRFAEAHALAHARAASVRADAACWCRHHRCAPHEGTRVSCAGAVVLVLRHDPAVGQVWTLSEVCSACAPLMSHARVLARAAQPTRAVPRPSTAGDRPDAGGEGSVPRSGAAPFVPGGFSAPPGEGGTVPVDRRRRGRRRGRPEREGSGGL